MRLRAALIAPHTTLCLHQRRVIADNLIDLRVAQERREDEARAAPAHTPSQSPAQPHPVSAVAACVPAEASGACDWHCA